MMHLISASVGFVLGVISGFGLSTLLSLLIWAAFWLAVGTVVVLAIDASLGIGRRACSARVWLRGWLLGWWFRRRTSHLVVVR